MLPIPRRQKLQGNLQGRSWVLWCKLSHSGLLLHLYFPLWKTSRNPNNAQGYTIPLLGFIQENLPLIQVEGRLG